MPVIKPVTVKEHHFTTETNHEEVTVNINLTVTLAVDQNGEVTQPKVDTPDFIRQVPELEPVQELIDFGKDVN